MVLNPFMCCTLILGAACSMLQWPAMSVWEEWLHMAIAYASRKLLRVVPGWCVAHMPS